MQRWKHNDFISSLMTPHVTNWCHSASSLGPRPLQKHTSEQRRWGQNSGSKSTPELYKCWPVQEKYKECNVCKLKIIEDAWTRLSWTEELQVAVLTYCTSKVLRIAENQLQPTSRWVGSFCRMTRWQFHDGRMNLILWPLLLDGMCFMLLQWQMSQAYASFGSWTGSWVLMSQHEWMTVLYGLGRFLGKAFGRSFHQSTPLTDS